MTKEGKLILELVRQFVDGKQGYPIEQTLYNWGEIVNQAIFHKIVPVIFWGLKSNNMLSYLPNAMFKQINIYTSYISYINKCLLDEAESILKKIPEDTFCIVLKGPVLAGYLYKEGIRTYSDIDLLVNVEDLQFVKSISKESGYIQGKFDRNKCDIIPASRKDILEKELYSHETVEFHKQIPDMFNTDIVIDINHKFSWKPQGQNHMKICNLDNEIFMYEISEHKIRSFRPEILFFHTCMHLYSEAVLFCQQYSWSKNYGDIELNKYIDIALFLKTNMDFDFLEKFAVNSDSVYVLKYVLSHIKVLFPDLAISGYLKKYVKNIEEVSYYYTQNGDIRWWKTSFIDRIFDQKLRYLDVMQDAQEGDFAFR